MITKLTARDVSDVSGLYGKLKLEIDKEDILAHTSLSMFYQAQGKIEEAEKEGNAARILGWKQELRGNPGNSGSGH